MHRLPNSPDELLEQLLERQSRPDIGEYAAPRDDLERAVCEIWSSVLLVDRVGRDDNIFDLGADSFHMAMIGARLIESYGLEIQIADFFEYVTVVEMAAFLRARQSGTVSASVDPPRIE